jgi:hypothetical protein
MPRLPLGLTLAADTARRAGRPIRFLDLLGVLDPVAAVRQAFNAGVGEDGRADEATRICGRP